MKETVIDVELEKEVKSMGVQRGEEFRVAREAMQIEKLMDTSKMLAESTVIPIQYQKRPENVFIALDLASRMGVSPMIVMQNLFIIQGKPSFSGQAIASMIRANPEFKSVELMYVGEEDKDTYGAYVQAVSRVSGKLVKGGVVTIATAKKEGWYQKSGSKWQTMPTIMLAYRAYAWFGRVYCPEVMMGLQSTDEIYDVVEVTTDAPINPFNK